MSSLCSSRHYLLWYHLWCATLPLLSWRRIFQTLRWGKDPALQQQACQLYLEGGNTIYLLGPRYPSLDGLSLVGTKFPSTPRKLAADLSLLLYRNWWTLHSHRKKNSQCWLMLAMDFIFGKVRDFVCQIKHLTTMGYDTDMLKSHDDFIPHAKHYAGKTFTTQLESLNCRLRHYLARLHRKTLCYSKSNTILEFSFKLLINKLNIT